MIVLVIDPGLFYFDVPTQQDLRFRLARIRQLRQFSAKLSSTVFVLPRRTTALLARHNLYPAFGAIASALTKHGLNTVFTPQDIAYEVGHLLQSKALESYVCVEDAAWNRFDSLPNIVPTHTNQYLDEEVQRILVVMLVDAIVRGNCRPLAGIFSVFGVTAIRASADVSMIEPDNVPGFAPIELPKAASSQLAHATDFEGLCSLLDPECLWNLAETSGAAKCAIQLRCRHILKQGGEYNAWESVPQFYIGDGFLQSARTVPQFASVIFNKSALIVLDAPNLEAKPLMSSTDANATQISRRADGALAFRIHLTKSHEAMRLMYWQRPDGKKELANVGIKAELRILEGDPRRAV